MSRTSTNWILDGGWTYPHPLSSGGVRNSIPFWARALVGGLVFATSILSGPAWADDKPQIRALLVGAGAYQIPDAWSPLKGPPGDIERLRKTLSERFSTPAERLTLLAEAAATRAGIEKGLTDLVAAAQPGETLIFYYAGHGFAVPNRAPTAQSGPFEKEDPEEDGMDECLVAIDCPASSDPGFADKVVRDDFFEAILQQAVAKVRPGGTGNGSVIFIFDSCHSGTISRGADALGKVERTNLQARGAAPPKPGASPPAIVEASHHAAGDKGWVVLSACGARQTAKEDPAHGGDFTNALVVALEDPRLGPGSTYRDLMRLVGSNPYFYDQTPTAEGDRDLVLFAGQAQPRESAISVIGVQGQNVTLDRGSLLGVTPGSKVALYKVGAKSAEDKSRFLTQATVLEQGTNHLYRAVAKVDGGDAKDLASAVGWVSEQSFGQVELNVYFEQAAESLAQLTEDPVVKKVSRGSDATVLAWNESGKLRLERSTGGDILAPTADPTVIRRALRGEARRQYLTRMVNSPQELDVELVPGKFAGSLASFAPNGQTAGSDGLFSFGSGDQALMKITNKSTSPLYISVLNFTADGGVKVLYPYGVEVNKLIAPGQSLAVDISFDGGSGQEGFKVIGTSQEIDLLFLETNGQERSAEQPEATLQSPFGQLMGSVMTGTRAGRPTISQPASYVAREVLWVNLK